MDQRPAIDSPLFEGVPAEHVQRLLSSARRRTFKRDEVVFHEGDVAASLHVIVHGRFAVVVVTPDGNEATLVVLPRGEIFGEMALFGEDPSRSATVWSMEAGETLAIDRREFDALRREHPEVNEVLLAVLAHKVRRYTALLVEALYVPAERRVLRRVVELAAIYGQDEDQALIPLTQEDLGGLAGTSRATVNKVLREEEERGAVALGRRTITVMDLERLRGRAR